MMNFVEDSNAPEWRGYLFAVLFFITAIFETLLAALYQNTASRVGMRIHTALMAMVYKKSLTISNASRKETTIGEIVNLMAVDAEHVQSFLMYMDTLWTAPLQIILSLYFLWQVLGISVLAGLAVMIVSIPLNGFIANKQETLGTKEMNNKDERIKIMNEVISSIKVLKLYAWEPSFEHQVLKIRNKEIKVLKQYAYLTTAVSLIWAVIPFLVSEMLE